MLHQHNIWFIVVQPEVEDETNRIEAAGGRVICWDGYRVGGLLALSRAIGLSLSSRKLTFLRDDSINE